ncbi:hypothetical protein MSG28_006600 [Choristoneura fumiferana]|uniref:Uncharacterized protein n=1 Tax=Choristoneura fumiferana TaxID=7141 RepID=A0ACC0JFE4_CHOFU|nr:hypothetical protein MSG28_006600 [Choristoneura fumiferana]
MSLQETVLNHEISNVDFTKIAGLQQKRTLAFVNHFVVTTVQFLNKFTKDCEEKLMHFERKLEKVNASMVLLESKLSSIPEVNIPQSESPKETSNTDNQEIKVEVKQDVQETNHDETETNDEKDTSNDPSPVDKETISPEYVKFVKMVQVGVPLQAVKLKMMLEGLDSNMLDKLIGK